MYTIPGILKRYDIDTILHNINDIDIFRYDMWRTLQAVVKKVKMSTICEELYKVLLKG